MEQTKPSVYLNALPYLSVLPLDEHNLDLWVLTKIMKELPVFMLGNVLGQYNFEVGIDLSAYPQNSKDEVAQLNALDATFQRFVDQKTALTMGYPLLTLQDSKLGKPVAAPLFLWNIRLEPIENEDKKWLLSHDRQAGATVNKVLKNYLETRFDFDWEETLGVSFNPKKIEEYAQKLAKKLNLQAPGKKRLGACPKPSKNLENRIVWAGTIGQLLPSNNEVEKLPKKLRPRAPKKWTVPVPCLPTNEAQEQLVQTLFSGRHLAVEGATQSGKTYVLSSLLPTILANEASALVTTNVNRTFDDIHDHWSNLGMEEHEILFLENEEQGKELLLKLLETLPEKTRTLRRFNQVGYSTNLDKFTRYRKQLNEAYDALHQEVLDGQDWTAVVGKFLNYHHQDRKQYLARVLNAQHFDFTDKEYDQVCEELAANEPLFRKVGTFTHPMMDLDKKWFVDQEQSLPEAKESVRKTLSDFYRRFRDLYHKYMQFIDLYTDELRFAYQDHAEELENQLNEIEDKIHYYNELYGADFDSLGTLTSAKLRLLGVFSKRYQDIRAAKNRLVDDYERLQLAYQQRAYFDAKLPEMREQGKLADFEKKLEEFKALLDAWKRQIPSIVDKKVQELSTKSDLKPHHKEELTGLETLLAKALNDLNDAKLLKQHFDLKQTRAQTREPFLQGILNVIGAIKMTWDDFDRFYAWRNHWYGISTGTRQIIEALMKVYPTDWTSAFESWYLHHALLGHYTIDMLNHDWPIAEYVKLGHELERTTLDKAKWALQNQRIECIKQLKKEKDFNLQRSRAMFKNKPLKAIVDWLGIENLTKLFPVILAHPTLVNHLFEHKKPYFDLVVIDNADQLEATLGRQLIKLGSQRMALGLPESDDNEASILQVMVDDDAYNYNFLEVENKHEQPPQEAVEGSNDVVEPFQHAVYEYLVEYLNKDRLELNARYEGVRIDILVHPKSENGRPVALVCDGWMHIVGKYDYQRGFEKQEKLKGANYKVYPLWSVDWWQNTDRTLQQLVAAILKEEG